MAASRRVLIVDDDVDFADSLHDVLETENYLIEIANNADDGPLLAFRNVYAAAHLLDAGDNVSYLRAGGTWLHYHNHIRSSLPYGALCATF